MYRFIFSLLVFAVVPLSAISQIKDSTDLKCEIDLEAQCLYQTDLAYVTNNPYYYRVHNDIVSDIWGMPVLPKYNYVTDNPFYHSAFYSYIKSKTSFKKRYFLLLNLAVEHRGMSYGANDLSNIVVYPIYQFGFQESLRFLKDTLHISFKYGCYNNNKLEQGLKIYNLDTQGPNLEFNWNNFHFKYNEIGDLSFGIGLMLQELYDFSISYKDIFKNGCFFEFGFNHSINSYSPFVRNFGDFNYALNYSNYGSFGEYIFSNKNRIYYQYEIRSAPYVSLARNSAILLGAEFNKKFSKLQISLNPELRYYGSVYNFGHKDDSVNYRFKEQTDESNIDLYSRTVGRYLYPLMNYNNQFSQWAVYTDYQLQNIAGFELRNRIYWAFSKKIHFQSEIESCTLIKEFKREGNKCFTYFFYVNSLIYNIDNIFNIKFQITNKAMNLDNHFQTFYMTKKPFIGLCIRKELSK
jgi:hypothetical protein